MKDVHAMSPAAGGVGLRQVGLLHVRQPLSVRRADRVVTLSAEFAVHVDLPAERKGSDLSRNAQLLAEVVDATALRPVPSLESACLEIARALLDRHPYAQRAGVEATATYFAARGLSPQLRSFEDYLLLAGATVSRDASGAPPTVVRSIGAEAVGMTACPCAMESCRAILEEEFPLLKDPSLTHLPIVSHNQRNRTRLTFELPDSTELEVDEVITAIEAAQSSPTYSILKRGDEARVVLEAHRNPKFVEDVLRDLLVGLPTRFPALADATIVEASTRSEESIHKYDVRASHRTTMGELRPRRSR